MCFMDYIIEVCHLSESFFEDYPSEKYPEIAYNKSGRPYSCLMIETHDNYLICIPFRSHIKHKQSYMFKNTQRSKVAESGLDFSKIILIDNPKYIISGAVVDNDEYVEMMQNCSKIVSKTHTYINTYVQHITKEKELNPRTFERKYKYTTLKYFHNLLF